MNNTEVQLFEMPIDADQPEIAKIVKGVTERVNYFLPMYDPWFFDLRFEYPMNFLNKSKLDN